MIVYIEYVIINNFIITFMLLKAVNLIYKIKPVKSRTFLSCLFGTIISAIYPLFNFSFVIKFLLKVSTGFVICAINYKTKNFRELFRNYVTFMLFTAMYGGINLMIYYIVYGDFACNKTLPLSVILFTVFVITYFIKQISLAIYNKKQLNKFIYEITIINDKNKVTTNAFLDSGNILIDPTTNKPVTIINFKLFNKLFKNFMPTKLITKQVDELKNAHYINVSTVTKNGEMLVFSVDNIILKMPGGEKNIASPILGLTNSSLNHLYCDSLINPKLIDNGGIYA